MFRSDDRVLSFTYLLLQSSSSLIARVQKWQINVFIEIYLVYLLCVVMPQLFS